MFNAPDMSRKLPILVITSNVFYNEHMSMIRKILRPEDSILVTSRKNDVFIGGCVIFEMNLLQ